MTKRPKIFVEAVPLVDSQVSGVPHALAGLVAALAANPTVREKYEIVLVVPGGRMHLLDRWQGLESCSRKAIPMKFRIMNGLARRNLLPPMDLLLGPGTYLFGNFFNWSLTKRSRSFTYLHDVCFAVHPEFVQPDNMRMLQKNVPRFIRQSDYLITVSESAKKEISQQFGVEPGKIIVLYNGVNTNLYKPYPASESKAVAEKYGLSGKKYFLFIGNIEPRKNLQRLVEAMMLLPKDYALILVGSDGWLNEKVFAAMRQAVAAGHTVIKPDSYVPDEDAVRLLSGAAALVLPSLYEGFGLPALEALASDTPAVVADIPPLHEVTGDAGIFCDPYSPESIAAAMQRAVNLTPAERQLITQKGHAQVARFSWETSARTLVEHIEKVGNQPQR